MALSNAGRLAVGSTQGKLQIHTLTGGDASAPVEVHGHSDNVEITALAFSLTGLEVASADSSGRICVWNLAEVVEERWCKHHDDRVSSVAFSADGNEVATASDDKSARIWRASNGEVLGTLSGYDAPITGIAFLDSETLVTTSADGDTRLWVPLRLEDARSSPSMDEEARIIAPESFRELGKEGDGKSFDLIVDLKSSRLYEAIDLQLVDSVFNECLPPQGLGNARSLAVTKDKSWFAYSASSEPDRVHLCREDGKRAATLALGQVVENVRFSADQRILVVDFKGGQATWLLPKAAHEHISATLESVSSVW